MPSGCQPRGRSIRAGNDWATAVATITSEATATRATAVFLRIKLPPEVISDAGDRRPPADTLRQHVIAMCATTHPPPAAGWVSAVPAQWSTRSVCVAVVATATVAPLSVRRTSDAREKTI